MLGEKQQSGMNLTTQNKNTYCGGQTEHLIDLKIYCFVASKTWFNFTMLTKSADGFAEKNTS